MAGIFTRLVSKPECMVSLGMEVIIPPVLCNMLELQTRMLIREAMLAKIPRMWKRRTTESGAEISMETKRGLTIVNTVISNHILANCNESATTLNL
ncbi:uncharacterized protein TNIN_175581 [Trichonephila inaurata madagascariensis]|uniref:Uncharacterized protein n=1 Tax=Trichonephila inaurata madagascariensis TaxID=2747483 RepID=A0A8X6XLJ1_9ARAC|nr:uncharacterized protein TNIN_175581 [Trichonephila inaurata madagascariensis]